MRKKRILIGIAVLIVTVMGFMLYNQLFPEEFKVKDDEIAIRIKLDVEEDIGLVVYDYTIGTHEFGGGMSNADRSMIRHDEELIVTWNKEELQLPMNEEITSDSYPFTMAFRIITEYVDPNYENDYPEDITRYLEPIEWTACFGQEYIIHITGNSTDGYAISVEK